MLLLSQEEHVQKDCWNKYPELKYKFKNQKYVLS